MTNDVIDCVRALAPAADSPTEFSRARQQRKLADAILAKRAQLDLEDGPNRRARRMRLGLPLRRRTYLAGAAAAVIAAAGIVIPLSLEPGGTVTSRAAGPSKTTAAPVMQLASYRLRLPSRYHLTAAIASPCHPYILFNPPGHDIIFNPVAGGSSPAPTSPSYASQVASTANSSGGCLFMALLPPYRSSATGSDPEVTKLSDLHRVQVGQYGTWVGITTAATSAHDPGDGDAIVETMLYVEIPGSGGQTQDLVVGSYGLSQTDLVALVADGLSVAGSAVSSGTSIPIIGAPFTGQATAGQRGTSGNSGVVANSGSDANTGTTGNSRAVGAAGNSGN